MNSPKCISPNSMARLLQCWKIFFGLSRCDESVFQNPPRVVTHAGELAGYAGVYALFSVEGAIISTPPGNMLVLPSEFLAGEGGAGCFARACASLPGMLVLGPAWLGYCDCLSATDSRARILGSQDRLAVNELQQACGPTAWEHGGCTGETKAAFGLFLSGDLVSLASYEIWAGDLAHISVVTSPDHRGKGYGREVVASAAAYALKQGLLPQYRTLESNAPSLAVGEALGFIHCATSVAVKPDAVPG